jgi:hypothetical protein
MFNVKLKKMIGENLKKKMIGANFSGKKKLVRPYNSEYLVKNILNRLVSKELLIQPIHRT